MNWQKQIQNSVARRLALSALVGLAAVLIAVGSILAVIEHRSTHALMVTSTAERVKSMVAVADTADQLNRSTVLQSFSNFRRSFERTPSVNESSGEMTSAGNVVNDDFQAVDKFSRDTQGVALVFAKKGNSFVCISTSLRNKDGARAMDMGFDNTHAAYQRVMEGEAYTGRVTWFDRTFMAYYEPLKNSAGSVVGVFVIGNDVSLQDRVLEHQIADVRIFEDGGMYFIDAARTIEEARFLVHPTAKGKKVLEVYPQAGGFLEALQNSPDGYVRNAPNFFNAEAQDQWAVMRKTKSGDEWLVAEVSERESMAQYWSNMRIIWGLLVGTAVLLGVGLFILVRRTVSVPLGSLTSAVTLVAEGDLTQVFQTGRRDEIGSLINEVEGMRKCYLQALSQVRVSVDSIGNASAEIASGSQDLSARTEQAASNLQRTASSMAQLTGTVELSAKAARNANELATSAAIVAAKGGAVVSEVVATMNDINQSSRKISDITSLIDGIAFQTNILALNAAVEAARAGDQGRGFAVVASEVRSLAQRSASAAKEIKLLIGASVERVESGSRLVVTAGSTMEEIVSSVRRVRDIMGEISAATADQSAGIGQVNMAVAELDQMTQQNAALVEQSAAASESLRDQADNLARAVSIFKLNANPVGLLS